MIKMPIRKYEHLEIPFSEQYERKKRRGPVKIGYKKEEQQQHDETYSDARIEELSLIQNKYKEKKKIYEEYLDPKLIFKIDVDHNIFIEGFRNELNRMNINVLSESPDNSGYCIVFADDEELMKLMVDAGVKPVKFSSASDGEKFLKMAYDAAWADILKNSPELGPKIKTILVK